MKKVALFALNGEAMCFIHVLLNALELHAHRHDVRVVIEGAAVKLIPDMAREGHALFDLYRWARAQELIDGACRACSAKMGVTQAVEVEGLAFLDDMSGHPSMARYMNDGYQIITF